MAKNDEMKAASDADLMDRLATLKREQLNLRFQAATQQLEKPSRVREVRRTIARIKTEQAVRAKAAAASQGAN